MNTPKLTPRLVVRGADRAIAFYEEVFGATTVERYADDDGHVVHAALDLDGAIISLAEEKPDWKNLSPAALGGSPVILTILVADVDAVGAALEAGGAEVVFPISDQFYGYREGRFRDPFGHLWIVSTRIEALTPKEIEARMRGPSRAIPRAGR